MRLKSNRRTHALDERMTEGSENTEEGQQSKKQFKRDNKRDNGDTNRQTKRQNRKKGQNIGKDTQNKAKHTTGQKRMTDKKIF